MLMMTRAKATRIATPGTNSFPLGGADLAQREHRVREGAHEDADRELTGLVLQDLGDDPRRELAHPELDHHEHHRQDQRGEAHHRARDGAEDLQRCVRSAGQPARNESPSKARSIETLATDTAIPLRDADQRPEPHAGPQPMQNLKAGEPEQRPILAIALAGACARRRSNLAPVDERNDSRAVPVTLHIEAQARAMVPSVALARGAVTPEGRRYSCFALALADSLLRGSGFGRRELPSLLDGTHRHHAHHP